MADIKVVSWMNKDFESYFLPEVTSRIDLIKNSRIKELVLTAGPYRPYGGSMSWVNKQLGIVNLDFYSALRTGFGSLDFDDFIESLNRSSNLAECNQYSFETIKDYMIKNHPMKLTFHAFLLNYYGTEPKDVHFDTLKNVRGFDIFDYESDLRKFIEDYGDEDIDFEYSIQEHDSNNDVWYRIDFKVKNLEFTFIERADKLVSYLVSFNI